MNPRGQSNFLNKIAMAMIRFYQRWLSPALPSSCRFYPSCSQYALESFRRHAFLKAGLLTARRLLRCQPLHPGGVDPVPGSFGPKGTAL